MEFVEFRQDQKRILEYATKVTHRDTYSQKTKILSLQRKDTYLFR